MSTPVNDGLRDHSDDFEAAEAVGARTLLFHVHSHHSFDSWMPPELIVAFARRFNIDAVVVADHDSHRGSQHCADLAGENGPLFPLAAEYESTQGDIIAFFLETPIETHDPMGIIDETHAQGGLVALPHPHKGSTFSDEVLERADLIEVFNARTSDELNARATETALRLGKPSLAGADAHVKRELDCALNIFDAPGDWDWSDVLLHAPRSARVKKSTIRNMRSSDIIASIKLQRPGLFFHNAWRWLRASAIAAP